MGTPAAAVAVTTPVPAPGRTALPRIPPAAAAAAAQPLFHIERNKNANIVRYEARLVSEGRLDPAEPVTAYWQLLAGDGSRKKLNWLENKKAYGVRIKASGAENVYIMTLAAAPWLPLIVKTSGGIARAEKALNGRPSALTRMFIQSHGGLLGPKVEYIDLYGKDLKTGEELHERIFPK